MYNLTYLGHRVTLPWLDLRSNFDLDLSRSNYTWFDAPWRDKHDGIKIVALPLKLKILSSKNRFGKFWIFDPWWRQFWPEPKNDRNDFEMIFRELSNAVSVLSSMRRSRDRRGGVQTPPPPAGRGKSRGPDRARVKSLVLCSIFPLKIFFTKNIFGKSPPHSRLIGWNSSIAFITCGMSKHFSVISIIWSLTKSLTKLSENCWVQNVPIMWSTMCAGVAKSSGVQGKRGKDLKLDGCALA